MKNQKGYTLYELTAVLAMLCWFFFVCGSGWIVVHFLLKYW